MSLQPRLLDRRSAAEYLGLGLSSFERKVMPFIPLVSFKGITRFDRFALDEYIDNLSTDVSPKPVKDRPPCPEKVLDSVTEMESGISKKHSEVSSFAKAAKQALSK